MKFVIILACMVACITSGVILRNQIQPQAAPDTYWRIVQGQNLIWVSKGKPVTDSKGDLTFTEATSGLPVVITSFICENELKQDDALAFIAQANHPAPPAPTPVPQPVTKAKK